MAIEVVKAMKKPAKIDFIHCKSPEEILNYKNHEEIFILDISPDVEDVTLIEDMGMLKKRKMFTLHDFDLNFFLKLMKRLGSLRSIKIIALPAKDKGVDRKAIAEKVLEIILS